jgi:hypothetical protein
VHSASSVLFLVSEGKEEGLGQTGAGSWHHTYKSGQVESAIFCDIWVSEHIKSRKMLGSHVSSLQTQERRDLVYCSGISGGAVNSSQVEWGCWKVPRIWANLSHMYRSDPIAGTTCHFWDSPKTI